MNETLIVNVAKSMNHTILFFLQKIVKYKNNFKRRKKFVLVEP